MTVLPPSDGQRSAERDICDFLWFGYVPDTAAAVTHFRRYRRIADDDRIETFHPKSPKSAKQLLCTMVSEMLNGATEIALPLSAGLDSRGLLGALLECLPAKAIHAYTYGQPTTHDFSVAATFTKKILPHHHFIDVTGASDWSLARVLPKIARRPRGTVRDLGQKTGLIYDGRFSGINSLPKFHGFFGDALSGKHLPAPISGRWRDALKKFVHRNRAYKGDWALTPEGFDPLSALPRAPLGEHPLLMLDDQLDWCFRQDQRIWGLRTDSQNVPYYDARWIKSFLNLDTHSRINQAFYISTLKLFAKIFPDLHDNMPRGDRQSIKQQVDFGALYINNASYRELVRTCLHDLQRRDVAPWIKYDEIIAAADTGKGKSARVLYALTSLELNFKAGHLH